MSAALNVDKVTTIVNLAANWMAKISGLGAETTATLLAGVSIFGIYSAGGVLFQNYVAGIIEDIDKVEVTDFEPYFNMFMEQDDEEKFAPVQ